MPDSNHRCRTRHDSQRRGGRPIISFQFGSKGIPTTESHLRWFARVMPWGIALAESWQICDVCKDVRPWRLKWSDIDQAGMRYVVGMALPYGDMPEAELAALSDGLELLAVQRRTARQTRKPENDRRQSLFDAQKPTATITATSEEIERIRVDDVLTCDGCGDHIFPGDPAYGHATLFVIGCSRRCCADAAIKKTASLAWEGEKVAA